MYAKGNIERWFRGILEDNGGAVADKARTILLEDKALKDLRQPLEFISKNWRDLTPALMKLSCEAVEGQAEETSEVALAMSLMNLSFYLWDDIIDEAAVKSFKPSLFGKFDQSTTLIIGGLASAKAFSILNEAAMDIEKRKRISKLVWALWTKMAQGETATLRSRNKENISHRKKFWKIKRQAADIETCMKIGAIIGNGSNREITHLGNYGHCLGIILELYKDFWVSVNLTGELMEKIKNGSLPYTTLWASQRSQRIQEKLAKLTGKSVIEKTVIKEIVQDTLAAEALDYITENIIKYTKKAENELFCLKKNKATQTLKSFAGFQPRLFMESFSIFKDRES
jgi:geranylgeranyl diphosphate synthase type II